MGKPLRNFNSNRRMNFNSNKRMKLFYCAQIRPFFEVLAQIRPFFEVLAKDNKNSIKRKKGSEIKSFSRVSPHG